MKGGYITLKLALAKLAQLAAVDLRRAKTTTRRHALWNEEIHIDEELINLGESLETRRIAQDTLSRYPRMYRHLMQEQQAILSHCIGLVARMVRGERLPREYSEADTTYALMRLTRLVVTEARWIGKEIDKDILEALKPFLSLKQRFELKEWGSFSPRLYLQLAYRQLLNTYSMMRQGS